MIKKLTRYKETLKGIEFCHYSISQESYGDIINNVLQYNNGPLGVLNDSEVVMDEDFMTIEKIEKELISEYPILEIEKQSYDLKINLTDFKQGITNNSLQKILRTVQWNCLNTGLGEISSDFKFESGFFSLKLIIPGNTKIFGTMCTDLIHMGILPTHIKIN